MDATTHAAYVARRYEVWNARGASAPALYGSFPDRESAMKAMRRATPFGPCVLALGTSVLSVSVGASAAAQRALQEAVAKAHPDEEGIVCPKPATPNPPPTVRRPIRIVLGEDADEEGGEDLVEPENDDADEASAPEARCAVEGCAGAPRPEGYCAKHWARRQNGGVGAGIPRRAVPAQPLPAVETPAATPAPQPPVASEDIMPPKTDRVAPSCAVLGCRDPVPGVRADSPPATAGCCRKHRHLACDLMRHGRATAKTVVAHMSEGAKSPPPVTKAAKAAETPRPAKTLPKASAPIASEPAVELSSETVTVTVRLPDDLVRARRCADVVGLVALEALATLRADSSLADVARVLAQLPARGDA